MNDLINALMEQHQEHIAGTTQTSSLFRTAAEELAKQRTVNRDLIDVSKSEIDKLRKKISELENPWISVDDYLPQTSTSMDIYPVLVWCNDRVQFGWWNEQADRWFVAGTPSEFDIEYWAPIPRKPMGTE